MRVREWTLSLGILGLGLAGLPAGAADGADCEPSADGEKKAFSLSRETSGCSKELECLKRMHSRWTELLAQMPRDMRAHWTYGRAFAGTAAAPLAVQYLEEKKRASPKDPFYATAYGHALEADSEGQIAAYEAALALDPKYAWAHYYLAARLSGREHRDAERAKPHARAWLAACPADRAGLQIAGRIGDKELAAEMAQAARAALVESKGEPAARRYEGLWALEFKTAPASEHDALRERVRTDVARLKAEAPTLGILEVVHAGYALIGDKEARAAVEKEMAARFPCESATVRARLASWEKDHPRPEYDAADAVRRDYDVARFAFETGLARDCPGSATVAESRARTARSLAELSAAEVEGVLDDVIAARVQSGGAGRYSGMADPAVELAVNHRVRLDKLPELLKGWSDAGAMPPAPPKDAPESRRRGYEMSVRRAKFDRLWLMARADNLLGRRAERDAGILELEKIVDQADSDRHSLEAKLAWLRAEIAEAESKPADALVFYQQAASGLRHDMLFLRASRDALKRLGASDAALAALVPPKRVRPAVLSTYSPWKEVERELPPGSLELVGGGRWALLDDFEGKRTLVNVWATWCAPCKKELPELQKLHERIKGRSDLAVIALNVDDNPGLVVPFLKENGYTFPVALAVDYWDSMKLESRGIPQNWVVDGKGVARAELRGFGSVGGDRWMEAALARLEGKKEEGRRPWRHSRRRPQEAKAGVRTRSVSVATSATISAGRTGLPTCPW